MADQTPTTNEESQNLPQDGSQKSTIEVGDSTPTIDSMTMEGSGGFRGPPETVEATITYTVDTNGIAEYQSTILLSVDDRNIAHIEDISGDGTKTERFIPIMFLKQELSQHHPAIEGVAGVPSFGIVNNQLYDNQPQFNADQEQLTRPSANELSNGSGSLGKSDVDEEQDTGQEQPEAESQTKTDPEPEKDRETQEQPDVEGGEVVENGQQTQQDGKGNSNDTTQDGSDANTEPDEEFGIDGEKLVSEDGEWEVDHDASGVDQLITSIKNEERGVSMSVWDLREDDGDTDVRYGVIYYEGGENTEYGVETKEELKEVVEAWKEDPPKVV